MRKVVGGTARGVVTGEGEPVQTTTSSPDGQYLNDAVARNSLWADCIAMLAGVP